MSAFEFLTGDVSVPKLKYTFSDEDARRAHEEWGANCGPGALAVCLDMTLEELRPKLQSVAFEEKFYMTPSMMIEVIRACGARLRSTTSNVFPRHGLCRVQFHGPWTLPGANPRWAYRFTHWIHVRQSTTRTVGAWIFDINGGWMDLPAWEADILPKLTTQHKGATGMYSITHSWEITHL